MKQNAMVICKNHKNCKKQSKGDYTCCSLTPWNATINVNTVIVPRKYDKSMLKVGMRVQLISFNSMLKKCYRNENGHNILDSEESNVAISMPIVLLKMLDKRIVTLQSLDMHGRFVKANGAIIPYSFIKYVIADE